MQSPSTDVLTAFFARKPKPSRNERCILSAVIRSRQTSQIELARETNLPQQTVSRLVKGLLGSGALSIGERVLDKRRGRPGALVECTPDFAYAFGVSLMTDAMSVSLMDFAGTVCSQQTYQIPRMSRSVVMRQLEISLAEMLSKQNVSREKVLGIGIGISGYFMDRERARMNPPKALEEWAFVDIDDVVSGVTGLPVWVENDASAAAMGEALYGQGRRFSNFVYVYIAAGIGGGLILDRHLMRGANGNAGELEQILPDNGQPRPTLQHLQAVLAAHGVESASLSDLLSRYSDDWPGLERWIADTEAGFSTIFSAIAALLDVEAIVLGGRAPPDLARRILPRVQIIDHARWGARRALPHVVLSGVDGDACAIGAAAIPFKRYFFDERP